MKQPQLFDKEPYNLMTSYLTALTTFSTVTVDDAYTDISPSNKAKWLA